MIFVAGIHGAGKTTFCLELSNILGVPHFSASGLIKIWRKKNSWANDKLVNQIDENQEALLCSVKELNKINPLIILDGHFVLLNSSKEIVCVEQKIFKELGIKGVILIESQPDVVASRLQMRDETKWDINLIKKIMQEERSQAYKFSSAMGIPCLIEKGDGGSLNKDFLASTIATWINC